MPTTTKDRHLYVTVRWPNGGGSKTVTVRGQRVTPRRVIKIIVDGIRKLERKAG